MAAGDEVSWDSWETAALGKPFPCWSLLCAQGREKRRPTSTNVVGEIEHALDLECFVYLVRKYVYIHNKYIYRSVIYKTQKIYTI